MTEYPLEQFWIFSEAELQQILQYFQKPLPSTNLRWEAIRTCFEHNCLKQSDRSVVTWVHFPTLFQLSDLDFFNYYFSIFQTQPTNRGTAIKELYSKFNPSNNLAEVVCVKVEDIRPEYNNLKEWMTHPNHVYIGRRGPVFIDGVRFPPNDSLWANPFKVKEHGVSTIPLYEQYIRQKLNSGEIPLSELEKLRGKKLGCWCASKKKRSPCHGDVLVKLLSEHS